MSTEPADRLNPADIVAIGQLLADYGCVLDDRDWDRLGDIFAADAVLDYTAAGATDVLRGLPAVRAFFESANHPSAHHVTNVVVTRVDGEVRARSKFFVPYTRDSHVPRRWYGGDYRDVLVPTAHGWRIAARTCTGRWQLTEEGDDTPPRRRTF